MAAHARGLANHDGDLLDAAADRFADLGAVALAADAAAQAAHEHARKGHRGKEVDSSARAHALASQGEIRTPAVAAAARPLPISDREREIAMLVAAGWSNREVADRLFVSVRTVEGHLYRIFAKLGIDDRDQLIHLVAWSGLGLKTIGMRHARFPPSPSSPGNRGPSLVRGSDDRNHGKRPRSRSPRRTGLDCRSVTHQQRSDVGEFTDAPRISMEFEESLGNSHHREDRLRRPQTVTSRCCASTHHLSPTPARRLRARANAPAHGTAP